MVQSIIKWRRRIICRNCIIFSKFYFIGPFPQAGCAAVVKHLSSIPALSLLCTILNDSLDHFAAAHRFISFYESALNSFSLICKILSYAILDLFRLAIMLLLEIFIHLLLSFFTSQHPHKVWPIPKPIGIELGVRIVPHDLTRELLGPGAVYGAEELGAEEGRGKWGFEELSKHSWSLEFGFVAFDRIIAIKELLHSCQLIGNV